jgi:two-component system, LytTR family, sensor kinase
VIRLQNAQRQRDMREKELLLDAGKSRLKALRAQINPHFLFNALNAIASFTKTDPERAEKMVELLSEIFRYTLQYSEREWVKLSDELDFIAAYLEVERARFGRRLSTEISMEVETSGMLIPAMVVQTLVENAVKHGVSKMKKRGVIRISSVTDGTKLWVMVRDNGPGLEDESPKNGPEAETGTGMGLTNIRNRLRGYFGEDFELTIQRIGIETEAQMVIPAVERAKQLVR